MFSQFIDEIIQRGNEIGSHRKVLRFPGTLLLDLTLRLSIETNQFRGFMFTRSIRYCYQVDCSTSHDLFMREFSN